MWVDADLDGLVLKDAFGHLGPEVSQLTHQDVVEHHVGVADHVVSEDVARVDDAGVGRYEVPSACGVELVESEVVEFECEAYLFSGVARPVDPVAGEYGGVAHCGGGGDSALVPRLHDLVGLEPLYDVVDASDDGLVELAVSELAGFHYPPHLHKHEAYESERKDDAHPHYNFFAHDNKGRNICILEQNIK